MGSTAAMTTGVTAAAVTPLPRGACERVVQAVEESRTGWARMGGDVLKPEAVRKILHFTLHVNFTVNFT